MSFIVDYKFIENFSFGFVGFYLIMELGIYQFWDGIIVQWCNKFLMVMFCVVVYSRFINDCLNIYGGLNVGYINFVIEMMQGEEKKIKVERGIGCIGSNFLYIVFFGVWYCFG